MSAPSSDQAGIRQTIRALRKAGYTLTGAHDGEEETEPYAADLSEDTIIGDLTACDSSTLYVTLPDGKTRGHVFFVLGNEPFEVICDHTVNLDSVLTPLMNSWDDD